MPGNRTTHTCRLASAGLLITVLLVMIVSPVSADVIIDEELFEWVDTSGNNTRKGGAGSYNYNSYFDGFYISDVTKARHLSYIVFEISGRYVSEGLGRWKSTNEVIPVGRHDFTYTFNGVERPGVVYVEQSTNLLGELTKSKFTLFFNNWDIGNLSGGHKITLPFTIYKGQTNSDGSGNGDFLITPTGNGYNYPRSLTTYVIWFVTGIPWKNHIMVSEVNSGYEITLERTFDGEPYTSTVDISHQDVVLHSSTVQGTKETFWYPKTGVDLVKIVSPSHQEYLFPLGVDSPPPPTSQPTLRTGTVTMTDHNGTTITGFEVTAVNHYTGESYTVATETDIAVMTLPMDRTTEIRNPQTGVYETAPIGYYRFYGQAPGYRMLNEDGIRVAVMPEKYGTYKLCDIGVTSDSGPLTGKHQFQLRSRSDNSILQTGTISAKSATTGEWYNTTVNGGIATLILPYDTSNAMSQYAGNYYVYATSPGYEDSDYGTQIIVMPHTVSEIRTILLTPIGGVPIPGNVTLRIQAMSETGTGVVNAEIFIAGVLGAGRDVWDTYTASSTGYLAVSVPGNSTYDIVASGAGYYDSARRIQVFTDDPPLIEIKLYLSGAPTLEPTTEPIDWPTGPPATPPPGGIPDDDDDSDGFLVQAVRGIGLAFGVGFATAKIIFGMLLALAIGFATAKQLRGGAAEFGIGLLGGTMLGVLIGLLPVWIIVVLLLVVGLYIGNRYVGGGNNG